MSLNFDDSIKYSPRKANNKQKAFRMSNTVIPLSEKKLLRNLFAKAQFSYGPLHVKQKHWSIT